MRFLSKLQQVVGWVVLLSGLAFAQQPELPGGNAALRYWSAFSQVQDTGITDQQAKEMNAILDGTAPYDDTKYRELVEKNELPLEIMARATSLPECDWGLDYGLKDDLPVEYARKALVLGRLNVLHTLHVTKTGNTDEAIRSLIAGLRFSHDVANGGSLFATVIAKDLLVTHLKVIDDLAQMKLSTSQRSQLGEALARLGTHGIDWQSAIQQEMELLENQPWPASVSLVRITRAYIAGVNNASQLRNFEELGSQLPQSLRNLIPDPRQVAQQKQELDSQIVQTRRLLQ